MTKHRAYEQIRLKICFKTTILDFGGTTHDLEIHVIYEEK
jgi:hypothetical protein